MAGPWQIDEMNRMKWTSIAVAALGCSLAGTASAAAPGFYVTATAGTSKEDPKSVGINIGNQLGSIVHVDPDRVRVDDGNLAWGVGLGYRINDYLSGEIEYADFGTTDVREHYTIDNPGPIPFPSELETAFSSKITGSVLSLLGTMPVGQKFELFVRAGALFSSREHQFGGQIVFTGQDQKFADTVWLAGIGADWSFAKRWGVRAEYQQSGTLEKTILMGSTRVKRMAVSAIYRF